MDIEVFEFFVHWLYHQRLPNKDDDPELFVAWGSDNDNGDLRMENLVYLSVFCDMYDVPLLKRLSLDQLFEHLKDPNINLPSTSYVVYAFDNIPDDSPLCRLLIDMYFEFASEEAWNRVVKLDFDRLCKKHSQLALQTFFRKMLQRYARYKYEDLTEESVLDICDYHEHKNDEERQACAAKSTA